MLNNVKFDKYAYKNAFNPMDCWIMVHLSNEATKIITQLNNYEISKSVRNIIDLIEDITNWYIKFNRDRLKGKCGDNDWIVSTSVLNYIITSYIKLLAPFAPFITTQIYDELKHLNYCDDFVELFNLSYDFEDFTQHTKYIKSFELLKRISRLIRFARMGTKTHTSSKTPIKSCTIYSDSDDDVVLISETIDLIQTELNIIDINYQKLSGNIKYKVVPNYNILGKKYKSLITKIRQTLEKLVLDNKNNYNFEINVDDKTYIISSDEYTVEPIFNDNNHFDKDILVEIDFTYDKTIKDQHNLKKFITQIQQTRKNMGLHVWNKISIEIEKDDFEIVEKNIDYIKKRLECDVNINSSMKSNIIYESENDPDKQIAYSIFRFTDN
jgi:isoleucyl-tRNA synthetase